MFSDTQSEFNDLCFHIGLTLAVWQRLEKQHFLLFVKLLGAPKLDICSVIYHGIPSFEGRRVIVDRVTLFSELTEQQRSEWSNIHSALEKAATDRNKIAHYSVEYELIETENADDGGVSYDIGKPHLRPASENTADSLRGRHPDKLGHRLTPIEMRQYVVRFNGLAERLSALRNSISLPKPHQGLSWVSGLQPFLDAPRD
jgi:hypothetical protein